MPETGRDLAVRAGWAVAAGAALGLASFGADLLPGPWFVALQFLASTGFAWGCLAFVVAFAARTWPGALAAATVVLCTATAGYYTLNFATGRWRVDGLGPVLTAAGYWLLLSVAGGAAMGALAHVVRTGRARAAALAGGLACGLLAGAGIAIVAGLLAVGDLGRERLLDGVLQAVAGVLAAAWVFGRRPGPRSWPGFAAASLLACTAGALAWATIESVPVIGF